MANQTIFQNNDHQLEFGITVEPSDNFQGFSGARIIWILSKQQGKGGIELQKDTDDTSDIEFTDTSPESATVEVTLSASETQSLSEGDYFHEVVVITSNGNISTGRPTPVNITVLPSLSDEALSS